MHDPRIEKLARQIIHYSIRLQPKERVLIETNGFELPLTKALIREAYRAHALPFLNIHNGELLRELLMEAEPQQIKDISRYEVARMQDMHAYVGIRAAANAFELSGVPSDKMQLYNQLWMEPVHHDLRVKRTKWVVLRYPNGSMAQQAAMPTEKFEDFYFDVCNMDYEKMSKAMEPLVQLIKHTDKVKIVAPGTDLSFSIAGIGAVRCDGKCNLPDGEVYTAPVKESVEGYITYNTPSSNQGYSYSNVRLSFQKGKIAAAIADQHNEELKQIFDTDAGARYVGEFSFGLNPYITKPMNDILFDEKIAGSIHFTPGACYQDAWNGNKSAIHWDLVAIHTPEFGGGQIYFDDVLIRKDGLFVLPELAGLNPQNLLQNDQNKAEEEA